MSFLTPTTTTATLPSGLALTAGDITTTGIFKGQNHHGFLFTNVHGGTTVIPPLARHLRGGFCVDRIKIISAEAWQAQVDCHRAGMEEHFRNIPDHVMD